MSSKEILWHNLTIRQTLKELKSSLLGLTNNEASKLKIKYGQNILPKKENQTKLNLLINQFKGTLIVVLLTAGLISMFIGEGVDAIVIFAAVLINIFIGFIQENKAQKALVKLNLLVDSEAKVIREGTPQIVSVKEIVPGDLIVLEAGDKVPADARLIEAKELETQEAALTGEPQTVEKQTDILEQGKVLAERTNMVYLGTLVARGKGKALVTAIALKTQIGKIAQLIKELPDELTPLQKKLNIFFQLPNSLLPYYSASYPCLSADIGKT